MNQIDLTSLYSRKILLAEDDPVSTLLIKELLKPTKAEVVAVKDGVEVLRTLKENSFDLILMDINMPNMDGLQATRQIRSDGNSIPIIAQTAYTLKAEKHTCLAAGCNAYLPKPINKQELYKLLITLTGGES